MLKRLLFNPTYCGPFSKDLVKPPCGTAPNCTGIINGNYPDYGSRCQQYFTCQHEEFYGYTKCAASKQRSFCSCV